MTPGYGYFDTQCQNPQFGTGFGYDWNNWSTPYFGGFTSDPISVVADNSSKKEESIGDFLDRQKAHEEEVAKARIQGYAKINMLERGLSEHTVVTTIGEGEQAQQVEVYADASGNPLKFKVENGQVVFDEKGKPIQDPNGQVVPVCDKKSQERAKQKIEAGKKEDGSSVQSTSAEEYRKKLPWWKRGLRALGNMATGVWNMGKSLVGYGPDGKWDPLKALKNAAIVVAGVALTVVCPAAGPVLLYAGLAMGAAQVGKGVYKACTAKTVEEIDAAWQDTGVGVLTTVSSAVGLRGMGRAAGTSAFTPKGATTLIKSQASKSALTFKGGVPKWNKAQFKTNLNEINPFTKAERNFESTSQQTSRATDARLQQIDNELAALDPAAEGAATQRALLESERSVLQSSKNLATTARTKVDFAELNTQSGATRNISALKDARTALRSGEAFEFNGVRINPTEANITQIDNALQRAEALTARYNQLAAAKNSMMNSVMYRSANSLRKADNVARKFSFKKVRLATKKMHTRGPQRSTYMAGAPKVSWTSRQAIWNGTKKLAGGGMRLLMWEYELYKGLPVAGQTYANLDRIVLNPTYEYGSIYDGIGGLADGFLGTNSGAGYAPTHLDAAQTSQMIAEYDQEMKAIQSQMDGLTSELRQLA